MYTQIDYRRLYLQTRGTASYTSRTRGLHWKNHNLLRTHYALYACIFLYGSVNIINLKKNLCIYRNMY